MLAEADGGDKKLPSCWMLLKVQDGKFVRALPADKRFTCNPTGYYFASQ